MTNKCAQFTYDELSVGQRAEFSVLIAAEMMADFARLSGDHSPLHTDADFAASTPFAHPVAHGMIAGALFSRLVGMELPGKFALYLSQELKFHKPLFAGDEVVVSGEIIQKVDALRTIEIRTEVHKKSDNTLCVEGKALVRVAK